MGSNPIPSANPLSRGVMRFSLKRIVAVALLAGCVGAAVALVEGSRATQAPSTVGAAALSQPDPGDAAQPAEVIPVPAHGGLTVRLLDHYTAP